jgi:predicted TIM-barrel fold metal-dependent hydrolase
MPSAPGAAMFGTDYPVARRHMTLAGMIDAFAAITAELTETEQQAVFHNNAQRLYRFRDERLQSPALMFCPDR